MDGQEETSENELLKRFTKQIQSHKTYQKPATMIIPHPLCICVGKFALLQARRLTQSSEPFHGFDSNTTATTEETRPFPSSSGDASWGCVLDRDAGRTSETASIKLMVFPHEQYNQLQELCQGLPV